MLTKLRNRAQDEKGFTLIELLVVILIIGILAAIALPAFLNQRGKAQDTEAKSQVRTMQTAMETYYTDEQTYLGADLAALQAIEPSLTPPSATKGAQPAVTVAGDRDDLHDQVDVGNDEHVHHRQGRCRLCHAAPARGRQVRLPEGGKW